MNLFDIIRELERLGSILETKAATSEAIANEHAKLRNIPKWQEAVEMAKNGQHFAKICRIAAEKLRPHRERRDFTQPTWEEVLDYAKATHPQWPAEDVRSWFNHFETVGWRVGGGNGKPMRNWKRGADNGFQRWVKDHPQRIQPPRIKDSENDPMGWADFLKSINRAYVPYGKAHDLLKKAFVAK